MKCFNCGEETNPTLVYCQECGVPLDTDIEDIARDEEAKARELRERDGLLQAKGLFVLSLFLFGVIVALRVVILSERHDDYFTSYRVPSKVVTEAGIDPPSGVPIDAMTLPFPKKGEGGK